MSQAAPEAGIIFPTVSHAPASRAESVAAPSHGTTPMLSEPGGEPAPHTPVQRLTGNSPARSSRSRSPYGDGVNVVQQEDLEQRKNQRVFTLRGNNHVLIVDDVTNECFFLKWKTFNKLQRKGKELDPRYFNEHEKAAFAASDAKEWQSFIDTGAVKIIYPEQARNIPQSRIFARAMRYVRTNKNKQEDGPLEAKSRIVTPGDVDPDGDIPVEDGGFRTDAPTCPQVAFHLLCSQAVLKKRRLGTFDCKTAFLTGKEHDREIYCRPPKEGLKGVPEGSLLQLVKGAYGLREAPRLWYLKAREVLIEAGFEEMQTAKACFVLRDRSGTEPRNVGMLVLHVDDAAYAGEGPIFEKAMQHLRKKFTIGKEEHDEFEFLGRHVKQHSDYSIDIDQHSYVKALERVHISRERRSQSKEKLTDKELHDYRSLVGQLAWPARETMPQLCYLVSDLQQKVAISTVGDLVHANNVLNQAKRWALQNKQCLSFKDLGPNACNNVRLDTYHSYQAPKKKKQRMPFPASLLQQNLGLAAVHDASFMGQPNDGSQSAYCLMLCSTQMYEGRARTHLLDWGSSKIHRKVRSTLAAEAASAARAFDRGAYVRVMLYEIEHGWTHKWDKLDQDDCNMRDDWQKMCRAIPFSLGTDCKSLYDVCTKNGSMPDERRVALDLLDVRESIEEMGDKIRWIPTDHMLVDCMTKAMPAEVMLDYLKTMEYAFKYDDLIKNTKRELAKTRKKAREAKQALTEADCDSFLVQQINLVEHYQQYYQIFEVMYAQDEVRDHIVQFQGDFDKIKQEIGYRSAYVHVVDVLLGNAKYKAAVGDDISL